MNRLLFPRLTLGSFCLALAVASSAVACDSGGDDEASDEETTGDGDGDEGEAEGDGDGDDGVLGHADDIQEIWDGNCVSACHEPGGTAASTLDLSGNAYDNIVSAPSTQAPGMALIEPGSTDESYLVHKLRGTHVEAGGLGASMPSGGTSLPEATIVLIEEWVTAGAAP